MVELYPDSPLAPKAQEGAQRMLEWLATKDYLTGVYYVRRKAPDSAILYFKDVIKNYPETDHARDVVSTSRGGVPVDQLPRRRT